MTTERQALALARVKHQRALTARLPRATREALDLLEQLASELAELHGGRALDVPLRGMAFAFDAPVDALAWAQRLQRESLELPWPPALLNHPAAQVEYTSTGSYRYRGLRVGVAIHGDRPDEVGLRHLARLGQLVDPGRLLLSEDAAFAVEGSALAGRTWLNGLRGERPVFDFKVEGLERSFDPVELRRRLEPEDGSRLYGREGDLAALAELMAIGIRLVSLDGDPGVGKSRLLVRFVRNLQKQGRRVLHVDLEAASDSWDVLYTFATALHITLVEDRGQEDAIRRVVHAVAQDPVQVMSVGNAWRRFAAETLTAIITASTDTLWVVANAGRLGVVGEVVYEVQALSSADARGADAVRLLDECARRVRGDFNLGTGNEAAAIANEVGGNPLCIELAAVGVASLRPLGLFERLTARRGAPLRVLGIVVDTLEPAAVQVLADLTVFKKSFARDLALEVVAPDLSEQERSRVLDDLVRMGLVRPFESTRAPGVVRLRLHRRVREALPEWASSSPKNRRRFAAGLAVRMARWGEELNGWRGDRVEACIALERRDVERAVDGLLEVGHLQASELAWIADLLEPLVRMAVESGPVTRLLEPLERALTAVGGCLDADPLVAAALFRSRGSVFARLGMAERALGDLERAQDLAERWAAPRAVAQAKVGIGLVHINEGRWERAEHLLRDAVMVFDDVGCDLEAASARARLARVLTRRGLLDEAADVLDAAAIVLDRRGHMALRAELADSRAHVHRRRGETDAAVASYRVALALWVRLGRGVEESVSRFRLASLLQGLGGLDEAQTLFQAAAREARLCGDHARVGLALTQIGLVHLERGAASEARATFVRAISASRAGGDRAGQGAATGFMGLLDHFEGDLELARQGYRAALRDLESGGGRQFGALFHSCLGAAEAELGNLEDARILVDLAEVQLTDGDPGLREAITVFHQVVDLARADVAEADGNAAEAASLRGQVRAVLEARSGSTANIYVRFAHQHLAQLTGSGTDA